MSKKINVRGLSVLEMNAFVDLDDIEELNAKEKAYWNKIKKEKRNKKQQQ